MSPKEERMRAAISNFLTAHPDVKNPAMILHGIFEANPALCHGKEIDLEEFGRWVQYCEEPPR